MKKLQPLAEQRGGGCQGGTRSQAAGDRGQSTGHADRRSCCWKRLSTGSTTNETPSLLALGGAFRLLCFWGEAGRSRMDCLQAHSSLPLPQPHMPIKDAQGSHRASATSTPASRATLPSRPCQPRSQKTGATGTSSHVVEQPR